MRGSGSASDPEAALAVTLVIIAILGLGCLVLFSMREAVEKSLVDARAEISRLKRGDFTEEELQAMCHNFTADDVCRFRKGCEEYQRKLFGNNTSK